MGLQAGSWPRHASVRVYASYMASPAESAPPGDYLGDDEFIQVSHPAIQTLARTLRQRASGDVPFAKAAFEWVRDQIGHSYDVVDPRVTLTASEVLEQGSAARIGDSFGHAA